jgi:RNA polymerase sigma-70 factor (ECF subfamily)
MRDQLQKRLAGPMGEGHHPALSSSRPDEGETSTATVDRVPDPAGVDLDAIWDKEWEAHLLQTALTRIKRQVNPQHYEIYHLHVVLGQSIAEVTRALKINRARIYLATHRVGKVLQKELRQLKEAQG